MEEETARASTSPTLEENLYRDSGYASLNGIGFKRRRPWFINWSNNALATVPFPSGMVGRFLKPQFRAQHERPGFLTARNHVRRPLGLALVDEPMAQLHGCATHV